MTTAMTTPADIIWSDHVNLFTWMGMGARPNSAVRTENGLMIDIYLGLGSRKRRLIVEVNGLDLYDITIGRTKRGTYQWVVDHKQTNIYAEDLDAAIRNLYDQARDSR